MKEIAERTKQSMTDALTKALDVYRRQLFFDQMNAGYAELRADPESWAAHLEERKQWDEALLDGLESESDEK